MYQRLGGPPMLLALGFSMMSMRDDVLADLSIFLSPFLPTGSLTDSMLQC